VKAQNVNAGFIFVYQTTDSEKNSVISLFIQMMWIFQPQHRILLYNLTVSHSIKKLNTFAGTGGSSVYIKKLTSLSFVLILSYYLSLSLASGVPPPDFSTKILRISHLLCSNR
jgi:maltodextrin utilization protein YvdJ